MWDSLAYILWTKFEVEVLVEKGSMEFVNDHKIYNIFLRLMGFVKITKHS